MLDLLYLKKFSMNQETQVTSKGTFITKVQNSCSIFVKSLLFVHSKCTYINW